MKLFKANLWVKPGTKPISHRPRPTSFAIRDSIEKELDRLEQDGIIKKMEISEWAAPIGPVPKKDGKIRLCGDYKVSVNPHLEVE